MAIVPTPTVPQQFAGEVAASADMNTLAGAAQFLLNKPLTIISSGTHSATVSSATGSFSRATYSTSTTTVVTDTDGMLAEGVSLYPSLGVIGVLRYGIYYVEAQITMTLAVNNIFEAVVSLFAGSNNPFVSVGNGVWQLPRYFAQTNAVTPVTVGGLVAAPAFPGDLIGLSIGAYEGFSAPGSFVHTLTARWVGLP
jgi:hypothetical protein